MVKTYRPILHEFEAGAKVSQADVAVHIQQNVVGLDVPEKRRKGKASEEGGRIEGKDKLSERFLRRLKMMRKMGHASK